MSEFEDVRGLFLKYGIQLHRRFNRNEKDSFCSTIGKDFEKAGYPVKGLAGKHKVRAIDVIAGNAKNAKTLVISNYDTPLHNFGNPFKYYPLNGPSTVHSSTLPYYTPQIISMAIAVILVVMYVNQINFQERLLFSVVVTACIFACCILGYVLSTSFGNQSNMNRNTSGCVGALLVSSKLKKSKTTTAFVLTDYGCSRHAGDYILHNELGDSINNKQIILFDTIGKGDTTVIGYQEGHKQEAEELASYIPDAKIQLVTPACLKYTSFSFYPSGLLVTRGDYNETSHALSIENTATKNDDTVDPDYVETLSSAIAAYLEKEKPSHELNSTNNEESH